MPPVKLQGKCGEKWGQQVAQCFMTEGMVKVGKSVRLKKSGPNPVCPISQDVMKEPVLTVDGGLYNRKHIEGWFQRQRRSGHPLTSPLTNLELDTDFLLPLDVLKVAIEIYLSNEAEASGQDAEEMTLREALRLLQEELFDVQDQRNKDRSELQRLRARVKELENLHHSNIIGHFHFFQKFRENARFVSLPVYQRTQSAASHFGAKLLASLESGVHVMRIGSRNTYDHTYEAMATVIISCCAFGNFVASCSKTLGSNTMAYITVTLLPSCVYRFKGVAHGAPKVIWPLLCAVWWFVLKALSFMGELFFLSAYMLMDKQGKAVRQLARSLWATDVSEVKEALLRAQNLGMRTILIDRVQLRLLAVKQEEALARVLVAMQQKQENAIEAAIEHAEDLNIDEWKLVEARDMRDSLRIDRATRELQFATTASTGLGQFERSIARAELLGADRDEISRAKEMLALRRIEEKKHELQNALQQQDIKVIEQATASAEQAGVPHEHIEEAVQRKRMLMAERDEEKTRIKVCCDSAEDALRAAELTREKAVQISGDLMSAVAMGQQQKHLVRQITRGNKIIEELTRRIRAPLVVGVQVHLHGLTSKAHLNGSEATLVSQTGKGDDGSFRWHVRLDSGADLLVKPDNLKLVFV